MSCSPRSNVIISLLNKIAISATRREETTGRVRFPYEIKLPDVSLITSFVSSQNIEAFREGVSTHIYTYRVCDEERRTFILTYSFFYSTNRRMYKKRIMRDRFLQLVYRFSRKCVFSIIIMCKLRIHILLYT